MKIYAEIGGSAQQLGGACPEGWVEVVSERPSSNHVSNESGEWVEKSASEEETLQARKVAYADTSTGSDALFIEYQALVAKGSDDAEAAKEAWLARREEIKLEFPL